MKRLSFICMLIGLIMPFFNARAQNMPDNVCSINNGRIYFQFDDRWTNQKKKEIATLFGIDSTLMAKAFTDISTVTLDKITWNIRKLDDHMVELSKPLENKRGESADKYVFLLDDDWFIKPPIPISPIISPPKKYGVNKFAKEANVIYANSVTHFFLSGYRQASKVFLSGTFNNWSTMQLPMSHTSAGWEVNIKLSPGKYLYKFIADGRWIHDPNNVLKEKDGAGGYNSVFYCHNHLFELKGYSRAKNVILTGSFNGWNKKELKMIHGQNSWSLPVYLDEGTYAYKYLVDGAWITDPDNKITHTDAYGNMNSFIGIGDTMVFRLKGYGTAKIVVLTGSFNGWIPNEIVMNKTADGWEIPYVMAPGYYEYKFIVDGQWITDPANPVTNGSAGYTNSCIVFKPNYTFKLANFPDAQNVIVTGSFNNWQTDSYPMINQGGTWICPVYLKPGKYTYKFILDGSWMIDPANELRENNEVGTGNSVLWIEP